MCERVFSVGFGPGLDSMSPARSRRSASHAAGTHGWLPQKTGRPGLRRGGVGGYNLHSVPPDCGTPTTSRLYPFGAPDVSLSSPSLITSSEWQTHTTMSSDHLPILIGLQTTTTLSPARHRTYINPIKIDIYLYMTFGTLSHFKSL